MKSIKLFIQKNGFRLLISTIFGLAMTVIGISPDVTDIPTYSTVELVCYIAFTFIFPFAIQWHLIPQIIDCY